MATKKTVTTPTQPEAPNVEPVAQTAELPVTESTTLTLEQLIASRKEMDAQIRALTGKGKPARKGRATHTAQCWRAMAQAS